jgi:TetR/AcrR family transcriptional repressor of bet genes
MHILRECPVAQRERLMRGVRWRRIETGGKVMPKVGMEPIRREQIRNAAAKVISKRGFDRTKLADVAKAAKCSTGMINHYYKSTVALLVDTLLYVSEWFQDSMRAECATKGNGIDKLRVFINFGVFETKGLAHTGSRVWAWAMAEAMLSKEMYALIQERRRSFEDMIVEVLFEIEPSSRRREALVRALAAELDAYLNGIAIHIVTGAKNLDPVSTERSLLAMVLARLRTASEPI